MPFKTTCNHYPEGIETLDLETAFRHDWNEVEYIRIGVVPEEAVGETGAISFQLVQFSKEWACNVLQAVLLESEIDMVIEGLGKAKARLRELSVL